MRKRVNELTDNMASEVKVSTFHSFCLYLLSCEAKNFGIDPNFLIYDMGEQVKIYDLAENLIRLMGYEPNKDIMIEEIGLRPGEKMYEELLMSEEGLQNTENNLIHIGKPIVFDESVFEGQLEELNNIVKNENPGVRKKVSEIVSTYVYTEGE